MRFLTVVRLLSQILLTTCLVQQFGAINVLKQLVCVCAHAFMSAYIPSGELH